MHLDSNQLSSRVLGLNQFLCIMNLFIKVVQLSGVLGFWGFGVLIEGKQNNFKVIQVEPDNLNWVEKIKRDYLRIKLEIRFD